MGEAYWAEPLGHTCGGVKGAGVGRERSKSVMKSQWSQLTHGKLFRMSQIEVRGSGLCILPLRATGCGFPWKEVKIG